MRRLLLAYDGSPCAEAALDDLANAGLPAELDVMVLSVADVWLPTNPDSVEPVFPKALSASVRKARTQALEALDAARLLAGQAAQRLKLSFPNWQLESAACADSPGWAVAKKAREWNASLVVLGSHGRSPLQRLFLGSVAQKVAVEAPCSVRIARPRAAETFPPRLRIMVAVDGSAGSELVLRELRSRTWPSFAEFRIVTVIDSRLQTAVAWPGLLADRWVQPQDEESREWIRRMAQHSAEQLSSAGLAVETHIFEGEPTTVLLAQAEDWGASCVFVGDRGLNHGNRLTLGTVASSVAARAPCSVEISRGS